MHGGHVLILEDDEGRMEGFLGVLAGVRLELEVVHWRNGRQMIRECGAYLGSCRLICLDHDLEVVAGGEDPGDGLEVARYLAGVKPVCPVLIHSSNGEGVQRMRGELEFAGWDVATVLPFGEGWIESYWRA
jgi:hypothetical protein